MNAWIKAGAVLAGYCLAIFVAAGVVVVHYTLTDGPEAEAESGMRAAGDVFLFIAIFGAMAVVPTVMALRFLRGSGWFWRALAGLALVVACAGIAACVVFGLERLRPFGAPDDALASWAGLAVIPMLLSPFVAGGFGLAWLMAPPSGARRLLLLATIVEGCVVLDAIAAWAPALLRR